MDSLTEIFGEPISVYPRAQAIEDGVLVDVTTWASADKGFFGGFKIPVALTASVWGDIEAIPEKWKGIQDIRGRAHDVLWMASLAARRAAQGANRLTFKVKLDIQGVRKQWQEYKALCGPGDESEPTITIMQIQED